MLLTIYVRNIKFLAYENKGSNRDIVNIKSGRELPKSE